MTSSRDALALLRIAADITRAGSDPELWPNVFRQISNALGCSVVFGEDYFFSADKRAIAAWIASKAADCANGKHGQCGCLSGGREHGRDKCLALVEHIDLVLGLGERLAKDGERHVPIFNAIPRPLFIIDQDARLLYTNEAGTKELLASTWLKCEAGNLRLVQQDPGVDLGRFLSQDRGEGRRCEKYLRLQGAGPHAAELWFRELAPGRDSQGQFLVSLVSLEEDHSKAELAKGLTPRQLELSRHLLSGLNLSEAARRMGIARRTAKDHLEGLFNYSGTRSQVELVTWLTRQKMS